MRHRGPEGRALVRARFRGSWHRGRPRPGRSPGGRRRPRRTRPRTTWTRGCIAARERRTRKTTTLFPPRRGGVYCLRSCDQGTRPRRRMEDEIAWEPPCPSFLSTTLGCGYSYYAEPLRPLESQDFPAWRCRTTESVHYTQGQAGGSRAADDRGRAQPALPLGLGLRASARPIPTPSATPSGRSSNPDERFTVFLLSVKNYEYPKVYVDPARASLSTPTTDGSTGPLTSCSCPTTTAPTAQGYRGNEHARFRERTDRLNRTMFPKEMIFSGQELEGFLVFRSLHSDVANLTLTIHGAVTRFDYRNEAGGDGRHLLPLRPRGRAALSPGAAASRCPPRPPEALIRLSTGRRPPQHDHRR